MAKRAKRRLIWVRVIHSEGGLGGMSESVKQACVAKMGRAKWERHVRAVRVFWSRLEEQIKSLRLRYERLRLYQDGLPYCGREVEIVRTLAQAGSLNCRLLLKLMERGAWIIGTESPELLLAEYDLARKTRAHKCWEAGEPARRALQHRRLLELRDGYVAARIDRTLAPGETGLIFLGARRTLGRLPADIRVMRLHMDMHPRQTKI